MNAELKFLIFIRSDRFEWTFHRSETTLAEAVRIADAVVAHDVADRAVVMEVGSKYAMPMFTFRHRARK